MMMQFEPNPAAYFKRDSTVACIIKLLHKVLRAAQPLLDIPQKDISLNELLVHCLNLRTPSCMTDQRRLRGVCGGWGGCRRQPEMVWSLVLTDRKCCNNILPMEATEANFWDDHLLGSKGTHINCDWWLQTDWLSGCETPCSCTAEYLRGRRTQTEMHW